MTTLKLKCAGAVSGTIEVTDSATVGELLRELEKLAGAGEGELKVIAGGKRLADADKDLAIGNLGITAASRLVATRAGGMSTYDAQASRLQRLERIQKAAEAIAARSSGGSRRFAFALETQDGGALQGGEGTPGGQKATADSFFLFGNFFFSSLT